MLLTAGNYPISGQLSITASGVVLKGQGNNATTGTRLEATGTTQRLLINISGSGGDSTISNTKHNITDTYVPEGAISFDVDSTANLSVGQTVVVTGATNQAWVHAIGMDELNNPWSPGTGSQTYYRVITAIVGNKITINAPITNYISLQYGGGTIQAYTWSKIISNDGLENIYAYSDSTGSTDTNHATGVLNVNDAENVFVNNITSNGFASNHIVLGTVLYSTLTNLTIENTSVNADPPSGILTTGQFILVENSTFINAYHAIAVNGGEGPNVFYNFTASGTTAQVGPHQRWSTGSLFDNDTISSNQLGVTNRANGGSGQGWAGAFYVFWNDMNAAEIDSFNPPTATNWVIGGSADAVNAPGHGDGQANVPGDFVDFGSAVSPQSLYVAQLLARETPTIATAAAASPSPITGKTTTLTALGADVAGESTLTYTWSATALPVGAAAPVFSINGTNSSKSTTATFSKAGAYTLTCTITYPGGYNATTSVNVTVNATLTMISVSPNPATLGVGATQHFAASGFDQFGVLLSSQPAFTWLMASGGGTVDNTGLYTAPPSAGSASVRAANGLVSGTANINIVAPPTLLSAVSRENQGGTNFDLNLALSGSPTIEPRLGGPTQIILTFSQALDNTSGLSLSLSSGSGQVQYSQTANTQLVVTMSGATDGQTLSIAVGGVRTVGGVTGNYTLNIGVLAGDVDQSGSVNVADISYAKLNSGFTVTSNNFLYDVTGDGAINIADISSVKLRSGDVLASGGTSEGLVVPVGEPAVPTTGSAELTSGDAAILAVADTPAIQETTADSIKLASATLVPMASTSTAGGCTTAALNVLSDIVSDTARAPPILPSHSTAVTSYTGPTNCEIHATFSTTNTKSISTQSPSLAEAARDRLFAAADFRLDAVVNPHGRKRFAPPATNWDDHFAQL